MLVWIQHQQQFKFNTLIYAAMTGAIKASESETQDDDSFVCPQYLPYVLQRAEGFSPHLLILLAVGGLPSCQGNDMLTSPPYSGPSPQLSNDCISVWLADGCLQCSHQLALNTKVAGYQHPCWKPWLACRQRPNSRKYNYGSYRPNLLCPEWTTHTMGRKPKTKLCLWCYRRNWIDKGLLIW